MGWLWLAELGLQMALISMLVKLHSSRENIVDRHLSPNPQSSVQSSVGATNSCNRLNSLLGYVTPIKLLDQDSDMLLSLRKLRLRNLAEILDGRFAGRFAGIFADCISRNDGGRRRRSRLAHCYPYSRRKPSSHHC